MKLVVVLPSVRLAIALRRVVGAARTDAAALHLRIRSVRLASATGRRTSPSDTENEAVGTSAAVGRDLGRCLVDGDGRGPADAHPPDTAAGGGERRARMGACPLRIHTLPIW